MIKIFKKKTMIKLKSLLKESLLNELEFGTQKAFDSYQKQHDLRGDTEVTVAGKKMSVNQAVKQSKDASVKGNPVFGNNKGGEVFGKSKAKEKKSEPTTYRDVYKPIKSTFEKMGFKGGANEYGDIKYKKEVPNGDHMSVEITPSQDENSDNTNPEVGYHDTKTVDIEFGLWKPKTKSSLFGLKKKTGHTWDSSSAKTIKNFDLNGKGVDRHNPMNVIGNLIKKAEQEYQNKK